MKNAPSTSDKQPLLDARGRLLRSFWSTDAERSYARESVSRLRGREWELYQLLGEDCVFRLLYGRVGPLGVCRASFTDLRTGRYCISGPLRFFPGDRFTVDFTAGEPHHILCEDKDFFLSLDYDGRFHRLRCYCGEFDVELMLPDASETLYTASPFEKLHHFFYAGRQVFSELRGCVRFREKEYSLESAFAFYESGRGAFPMECRRVLGCACQIREGHSLALLFGWGFGYAGSGLENALFLDGEVLKLNRLRESRKGDFLRESRIFSEDGAVELRFTPWRDELFARDIRLLYFRSHCTVGKLSGTIDVGGYGTINIENVPILCEHSRFRF